MNILQELSEHDNFFKEVAFNICKDKDLASDLVQEMYINIYDSKKKNEIKNIKYYGIQVIRNNFKYFCNNKYNTLFLDDFINLEIEDNKNNFEPDDNQLLIIEKAKKLNFLKKNLIEESYEKSHRQIEKEFGINYGLSYRKCKEARQDVLGEEFKTKYKNSRNKRNG